MAVAVKGFLSVFVVVIILASSWLISILINYYGGQGKGLRVHKNSNVGPFPGDRLENIFWFMQISDIHISKFYDPGREKDLKYFCKEVVDAIQPAVVIATGDLTDAKHQNKLGSQQYQEEWDVYASVLRTTGVETKTKWLDIRGNHDAFDVKSLSSKGNLFRGFSASGPDSLRGSSSYQYIHSTRFGDYAFNAIDTCPDPGPKRPFNFFGHISQARTNEMIQLAEKSKTSNMTIWFGHYPFSLLTSPSLRTILRHGTAYLCGHLHTLGEVVPTMHAVHQDGHLELELGDWLNNRNFRVAAVDHDLLSFVDVRLNTWPIILVTNPKDAHYLMPMFEPIGRINKSTHIRMLIFSISPIQHVTMDIDGTPLEAPVKHAKGSLFVCEWEPHLYQTGLHTLTVKAQDSQGHHSTKTQQFSIDGTRPLLDLLPAIILLTDFCTLGRVVFYLTAIFTVLGLWVLRKCANIDNHSSGCVRSFVNRWFYNLSKLTKTDQLFHPLFAYGLYIVIGPWFIGELITDNVGCMFVFGVYVNGHFIPGSLTFYYGIIQLLTFNLPLTACLTIYVGSRNASAGHRRNSGRSSPPDPTPAVNWCKVLANVVFTGMLIFQSSSSYNVWRSYGGMAFALNPVKTWSVPLAVYLWIKANFS